MNAQIVDIEDPRLVKALAHPIRMKILSILDRGTATPKELAELLGLPLENVSYHVRTLKDFGFIKLERTRQVRGAVEHHYSLAGRPQIGAGLWSELPAVIKEALVGANLQALSERVNQAAVQGGFDGPNCVMNFHSLVLDEQGYEDAHQVFVEAQEQLEKISQQAQKRGGDGVVPATAISMLFDTAQPASSDGAPAPAAA
jgi:DNA-binding transcriptional ArsR family regulator